MAKKPTSTEQAAPAASTEVRARIEAERQRLDAEEARELQLMRDRLPPLEAGDDAALDAVEASINDSRGAQLRIQERIQLLTARLGEAEEREERERLDAVRERADRARQAGEKLLRDTYGPQAKALADTLLKLLAVDRFVRNQNRILDRAGQEPVASANDMRHVPARVEAVRVMERVGLSQPEHPQHAAWERAQAKAGKAHIAGGNRSDIVVLDGKSVPRNVEVEVVKQVRHPGERADPVYEILSRVPALGGGENPLFWLRELVDDDERLAAVAAELGL
jgi:hypothetical protein